MTTPTPTPKKTLSDSTKRIIRTIAQTLVALAVTAPVLATALKGTPVADQVGAFAAAIAAVSVAVNKLEDAGVLPGWLK